MVQMNQCRDVSQRPAGTRYFHRVPTIAAPPPGPFARAVARVLNDARTDRGMTTTELGVRSRISPSQMSKYLRAERTMNLEHLDAACRALGLDIVAVVREADRTRG